MAMSPASHHTPATCFCSAPLKGGALPASWPVAQIAFSLEDAVGSYILRRLMQTIPMLLIISIVLFALVNLAPGGPLAGLSRSRGRKAAERTAMLKRQFGLDKPLPVQYVIWLIGNDWMDIDADGDGVTDGKGERTRDSAWGFRFFVSVARTRPRGDCRAAAKYHLPDDHHANRGGLHCHSDWCDICHQAVLNL